MDRAVLEDVAFRVWSRAKGGFFLLIAPRISVPSRRNFSIATNGELGASIR